MKSIKNIEVKDKVILMRADYNVPLKNGQITDDLRIRASVPTIQYLLDHEAKRIVIMSHLGRPEGKDEELSLAPVAKRLAELLGIPVEFVAELTGELSDKVVLLENLRFDPREEENSEEFAKEMIDFVQPDVFVQDGFAVCHRAHASTVAMAKLAPVAVSRTRLSWAGKSRRMAINRTTRRCLWRIEISMKIVKGGSWTSAR